MEEIGVEGVEGAEEAEVVAVFGEAFEVRRELCKDDEDDLIGSDSLLAASVFSLTFAVVVADGMEVDVEVGMELEIEVEADVDNGTVELSYFPISCLIDLSSVEGFSLSRVASLDDDFMSE